MNVAPEPIPFAGRIVLVGFGSIGQAVLPLLLRRLAPDPARIRIVKPRPDASGLAARYGVGVTQSALTPANLEEVLVPLLAPGDLLLNASVDVSSVELVALCHRLEVLYLDTCNEPWPGVYDNPALPLEQRTRRQARSRLLRDELDEGVDELGVLLMGPRVGAYWYGSRLSIGQARALAPCNNATTLQVVAGILGGIAWMVRHPRAGIVEPDQVDHRVVLETASPYLGELAGQGGDWTPLRHRSKLYDDAVDPSDPWQFVNFRVA